tara:strand:+ start:138 stop:803 length:666 start_codon:yes stop_codon:yes gene_type:complete
MGLPRSGTTAVRTALDSHSQLKCEHELFNEENYNDNKPWSEREVEDILAHLKTVDGVHHNYDLPRLANRELVWDGLKKMTTHVVLVDRPKALDVFLSTFFAIKYNHWHDWVGDKYNTAKEDIPDALEITHDQNFPLASDFEEFLTRWTPQRLAMHEEVKSFKSHTIVDYEEFSRYTGRELRRIQEYLDVPFERIVPRTKKFNRQTKITNIEELKEIQNRLN